jgi:ArsR family transcriptional regulator, arsenate/arsenite/antimonite-responsive transcriptional repressor
VQHTAVGGATALHWMGSAVTPAGYGEVLVSESRIDRPAVDYRRGNVPPVTAGRSSGSVQRFAAPPSASRAPVASTVGTGPRDLRENQIRHVVREPGNRALPAVDTSAPVSCPPIASAPLSDTAAEDISARLRALAHPDRVRLISLLFNTPAGEECGRVLAARIGLPETTVSHHLGQLRLAGLIESQRSGMHVYHRPHRDALNALCTTLDPYTEFDAAG